MLDHQDELLPVVAAGPLVLFPGRQMTLRVKKKHVRLSLEYAKSAGSAVLFVASGGERQLNLHTIESIATLAHVVERKGQTVTLSGWQRVQLENLQEINGVLFANWSEIHDDFDCSDSNLELIKSRLKAVAADILEYIPADTKKLKEHLNEIDDPSMLMHLVVDNLDASVQEKQKILATSSIRERSLLVLEGMSGALESLKLQSEIRSRINSKLHKDQRENILREHMKAIQDELGDGDNLSRLKLKVAALPDKEGIRKAASEELAKLEAMGKFSPEAGMVRNYLETLVALPWYSSEHKALSVVEAQNVFGRNHYGLDRVKTRVLEHLAVMELKPERQGTILLLVGPPGVGKTSLARSIAEALNRPFVKASLGGIRDDAEIRGHRRTYIGALPGQIINGLKRAGQNNPIFLLDEIDKLTFGPQGDPAAALLEALDPEQNSKFVDHYLDLPFDLSKVLFICTANEVNNIPSPLLDRLESIHISSYTLDEKRHIANDYLIPKAREEHGLNEKCLVFDKPCLDSLILKFTREAGVRELGRKIAALARTQALAQVQSKSIEPVQVESFYSVFGKEVFDPTESEEQLPAGVATGLAYTPVGGDILFIETRYLPGKGKLILTGRLGEVMKESAQIALSLIQSLLPDLVPDMDKIDIHIHVPSGAVPKDGPSAGVALFLALASLFSKSPLPPRVAMTGEVSLSGKVMPVGGVKEKLIAAHSSGITSVFLSSKNKRDLDELPADVKEDLKIHFVDRVEELLPVMIRNKKPPVGLFSTSQVMN